jgi:magnesium transporter
MVPKVTEGEIARAIIQVLKEGKHDTFREIIQDMKPYDLANHYKNLPVKRRPQFLECLTMEELTGLLRHLSRDAQLHVLRTVGPDRTTRLLEMMKNNDLAFL